MSSESRDGTLSGVLADVKLTQDNEKKNEKRILGRSDYGT